MPRGGVGKQRDRKKDYPIGSQPLYFREIPIASSFALIPKSAWVQHVCTATAGPNPIL